LRSTLRHGKSASVWKTKPIRIASGNGFPHHLDLAAVRFVDARDEVERRRLAASGGADDRDEFAATHRHGEVAQRRQGRAGRRDEAQADVDQLDGGRVGDQRGHRYLAAVLFAATTNSVV
jgi:hypothetical protein